MKRIWLPLLLLLFLTACSLAPDEYLSVTPHEGAGLPSADADAVTVESYSELKQAILDLVKAGRTEGTIRVTNYDGNVEEDLTAAAYEVAKVEPLGAYAVDYMTHDCTLIVNYYEIHIRITFRRTAREIASIEPVTTQTMLRQRLERAVDGLEDRLILRVSGYREPDIAGMVADYCAANPATVLETPAVTVSVYPDSGAVRIVEVDLVYTESPETLQAMEKEVRDSISNAAEYIRYRQTDQEKIELLFTYLTERFTYTAGQTATPLYDALCAGVADSRGLTQAWQLICDQAGVECYTVEGLYNGESRTWNIVGYDGRYRHVDLTRCVLEDGALRLRTDPEMTAYYWIQEAYPTCIAVIETPEAPPTDEEAPSGEAQPSEEETPSDEDAPAAEDLPPEEATPPEETPEETGPEADPTA